MNRRRFIYTGNSLAAAMWLSAHGTPAESGTSKSWRNTDCANQAQS